MPNNRAQSNKEIRKAEVLKLRLKRLSMSKIAKELGISVGAVHKYLTEALTDARRSSEIDKPLLLQQELEALDVAVTAIYEKVVAGDLGAIDRYLKVIQQRCRLLGLDAPDELKLIFDEEGELAGVNAQFARIIGFRAAGTLLEQPDEPAETGA